MHACCIGKTAFVCVCVTEEEPVRTAPLANRRLPSLPKSVTGRMAGSVVYDTVVNMREWPAPEAKVGRRQTSSCSSLYAEVRWGEKKSEEASIFISAKPLSTRPSTCRDLASPSGDKDFPLYAKVNKTGKRMIKSELISWDTLRGPGQSKAVNTQLTIDQQFFFVV